MDMSKTDTNEDLNLLTQVGRANENLEITLLQQVGQSDKDPCSHFVDCILLLTTFLF